MTSNLGNIDSEATYRREQLARTSGGGGPRARRDPAARRPPLGTYIAITAPAAAAGGRDVSADRDSGLPAKWPTR